MLGWSVGALCNLSQPDQTRKEFSAGFNAMTMGEKRWKKHRDVDAGVFVWSVAVHNALTNGFQLHIGFCD